MNVARKYKLHVIDTIGYELHKTCISINIERKALYNTYFLCAFGYSMKEYRGRVLLDPKHDRNNRVII
jgi:hypothetical protein